MRWIAAPLVLLAAAPQEAEKVPRKLAFAKGEVMTASFSQKPFTVQEVRDDGTALQSPLAATDPFPCVPAASFKQEPADRQETPAEAFQKIARVLESAKTLRITFQGKAQFKHKDKETVLEVSGTLAAKGENKVRLRQTITTGGTSSSMDFSCDCSHMALPPAEGKPAPAQLRNQLINAVLVLGSPFGGEFARAAVSGRDGKDQWTLSPTNFRNGDPQDDRSTLHFEVMFDGLKHEVTLSYDPKTYSVQKRSVKVTPSDPASPGKAGKALDLMETWKVETDVDLPDDEFQLPAKK